MKLSCLSVSLFPAVINGEMTIKEYAELCKSLELDGFDLGLIQLKNHSPGYVNQIKKDIEDAGIPVVMVTTYPDFTHPDPMQREREFEYLRHDIALASNIGAKFLRITAGQGHPEMEVHQGIELVVENFRNIAPVAERFGIKLVYEDHSKPGAWEYMDFSNPPDIFLEIARQIKDTPIRINFDTANILVAGEDRTLEVLEKVMDQVDTIHVAETGTLGKMDPVPIGTGLSPIKEVFSFLKAHKFEGWLCIEEWGNQGVEGVKKAVAYTRKTWEEA
ncbi:MAG: sugar phosphate isomerase/epimerase [Bacteroidales bacterium]|nr:sugar phosphate isomerase/epimerase [Bacteroidales bacterium]